MSAGELQSILRGSVRSLEESFDPLYGGFGGAPKFPPSMVLEFLLRMSLDSEVGESALFMANKTLDAMARGGFMINFAVDSPDTALMPNGSFLISKKCFTTTRYLFEFMPIGGD